MARGYVTGGAGEWQEGLSRLGKWHSRQSGPRPWGRNAPGLPSKRPAQREPGARERGTGPGPVSGTARRTRVCPTAGGAREGVGQRRSSIRLNVSEKTLSLPRGEQTVRSACGLRGGRPKTVSASFQEGRMLGTARGSVYGGTDTHPDMSAGRDAARPRTGSAEARAIRTVSGPRGAKGVSAMPRTSAGGGLAGEGAGGRLPQLRALSSGCQTDEALTTRAFPKQKIMQLATSVHLTSRPGTLRFLGFGIFGDRERLYFGNGSTTTKHT